jgi:hypothetical protein
MGHASHMGHMGHHHSNHRRVHVPTPAEVHNTRSVATVPGLMHYERSGGKAYCPDGLWASIINLNVIKTVVFGLVMNPGTESQGGIAGIMGLPPALANMMGQMQGQMMQAGITLESQQQLAQQMQMQQMQMQQPGGLMMQGQVQAPVSGSASSAEMEMQSLLSASSQAPMLSLGNMLPMMQVPIFPVVVDIKERYHTNVAATYRVKKGGGDSSSDYVDESPLINFTGTFSGSPRYDESRLMQLLKKERAMSEATFRALPKPWGTAEPTPEQVMQWLKEAVHPVYHEQLMWDATYWGTAYARINVQVIAETGNQCMVILSACCICCACVYCCLQAKWEADPEKFYPARCKLAALEKAFFDKQEARFDAKYMGVLVEGRPASNGLSSPDSAALVNSQILEEVTRAEDSYVPAALTMER